MMFRCRSLCVWSIPGLCLVIAAGCSRENPPPTTTITPQSAADSSVSETLADARRGFTTNLLQRSTANEPLEQPPADLFRVVKYPSADGDLAAYVTPDPADGRKHPAIVWITGGDCNTIGDVWSPAEADNDQNAGQYRQAGIVMMFPSLRGGNMNPGVKEAFLGEVEDVIAAAAFLSKLEYVDPARIYLGGHSTGGTLALLVSESTDRFRAVFSFGPVANSAGYGPEFIPYQAANEMEIRLRSPQYWLDGIRSPTFVMEGGRGGNTAPLRQMQSLTKNPQVHWFVVTGADHFSILAPINRLIAERILKDDGPATNLSFTEGDLIQAAGH